MNIENTRAGFTYTFEVIQDGEIIQTEQCHNLVPNEGFDHMLSVLFKSGVRYTDWYIGLYTNNYTPVPADTLSTFIGTAGEVTAYTSATRVGFVGGTPAAGAISNSLQRAEFEIGGTETVTVRGGFISSSSTKGSVIGVLLSAVRATNGSNQPVEFTLPPGSILRVSAGFQFSQA